MDVRIHYEAARSRRLVRLHAWEPAGRVWDLSLELRQLVQEQDAMVSEADFPGLGDSGYPPNGGWTPGAGAARGAIRTTSEMGGAGSETGGW